MKPLLAACALAALVITWFVLQSDERGAPPEVPALENVVPAADGHAAELIEPLDTEAAPAVARVEALTENAELAPTPVSDDAPAPAHNTASVTVRVVDEDGAAVQHANVRQQPTPEALSAMLPGDGFKIVQGNTGPDGRVTLELSAGRPLELRGSRFGESSEGIAHIDALAAGAHAEVTIAVKTRVDCELSGRVVDAESGAPVPGIEVRVDQRSPFRSTGQGHQALPPPSQPDAVTDATGRFLLPGKSWQSTTVLCTGAGWSPRLASFRRHTPAAPTSVAVAAEAPQQEALEIELLRAARIEGTVIGAGAPTVADVSVRGFGLSENEGRGDWSYDVLGREYQRRADVDARGVFTLEDLPANADLTVTISLAATDEVVLRDAQPFRIAPGETHRASWTLGSGGRIECSVHHANGGPAPDEELWLLAYGEAQPGPTMAHWKPLERARTDASGQASFEDVQAGRWVVALAPERGPDNAFIRYAVAATIESSGVAVPVSFTLDPGLTITGTVLAPDGTPTPTYVTARNAAYHDSAQQSSVAEGKFRIGPLLPGRYRLAAHGPMSTAKGARPLTGSDPVEAEAGAQDVVLRLRAGCDFELTAIDSATGEPTAASFVLLPQERESMIHTGGQHTSSTLSGQAPGRYRVLASTEQGLVGSVELDAVASERHAVTVPVARGGSLRVEYDGAARSVTGWLERSGTRVSILHLTPGASETLHVPAGDYTLRTFVREVDPATKALLRRDERTHAVVIKVGEESRLNIER